MAKPDYLNLPFKEAIAYLSNKTPFPSESSRQFSDEIHDRAFIVSGLTKASLLKDIQDLLVEAQRSGKGMDEFKSEFRELVNKKGWKAGESRSTVIYDTNIRRSHAAGRRQQMLDPDVLSERPYWMWQHRNSPQPRPDHLDLNGKVFRANDPFWDTAYPPCGWGCRCATFSLNDRDMKRLGKQLEQPPDPKKIADLGFRSAPGRALNKQRETILEEGLNNLSPELRKKAREDFKKRGLL